MYIYAYFAWTDNNGYIVALIMKIQIKFKYIDIRDIKVNVLQRRTFCKRRLFLSAFSLTFNSPVSYIVEFY